jgi:peptidoglycan glycosyltransferase
MTKFQQSKSTVVKIQQVTAVIMLSFLFVGAALVYWSVGQAETILAREDNPRLVEAELRIQRGPILDREGTVLAETVGPPDQLDRVYPLVNMGPAIGYYSFRHGTAGIEEGFDAVLRGQPDSLAEAASRQLLHLPQAGQAVHLTLSAQLQQTADRLLPASPSALLLLQLEDSVAQILALVSHPSYNPNLLDEQFEALTADTQAPLLNRVTQGQYQPGRVLQPFILAAAVDQRVIELSQTVEKAQESVSLNSLSIECLSQPTLPATWSAVLQHRCPAPMMALGDQLGASGLEQIFADFGLAQPPELPLNTETAPLAPLADPLLASLGQDNLLVTPLQVALAWSALATDGRLPTVQLVTATGEAAAGQHLPVEEANEDGRAVASATAQLLRRHLGQTDNVLEHTVVVPSGPIGEMNAWYLGLAPANAPRDALVIVVENSRDLGAVEATGRAVWQAVLAEP